MDKNTARPRRLRVRRIVGLTLALALLGGGAVLIAVVPDARAMATAALSPLTADAPTASNAAASPARGVRVQTVTLSAPIEEKSYTGVVTARYQTALGFRVGGRIDARLVEVGQVVREGDVLMTLDPADLDAGLRAAEANLAAARAQAVQATAEEARQAQLLESGWIAQARYDIAKAAAEGAAEAVRAAEEAARLARNAQGYATLRAPSDGLVTVIAAEAGQVVPEGQPVLTLVRPGAREALVAIPEGGIAELDTWQAQASIWSGGLAGATATLREVSPQADAASRTHDARFTLEGTAATAELGATVTVRLTRSLGEPVVTLPSSAVLFRDGAPVVWRVTPTGDRVVAIPVEIVRMGPERADLRGLSTGDQIVILGVHRLDEYLPIRIVEDVTGVGG